MAEGGPGGGAGQGRGVPPPDMVEARNRVMARGLLLNAQNPPTRQRMTPVNTLPSSPMGSRPGSARGGVLDQEKEDRLKLLNAYEDEIVKKAELGDGFAIVCGETGSGKSTQIPHALMRHYTLSPRLPVIVAVPRRVAATGLYKRMLKEVVWLGGHESWLGYHIGGSSKKPSDARLIYCTAGWLFHMLSGNPDAVYNYSSIVIDEIHERSFDSDMLIGVIKCIQRQLNVKREFTPITPGPAKKFPTIIVMSATIKAEKFFNHFRGPTWWENSSRQTIPTCAQVTLTIDRPLNSAFPREHWFLEDLLQFESERIKQIFMDEDVSEGADLSEAEPEVDSHLFSILFDTIERLGDHNKYSEDSILVFLPGVPDIEKVMECYEQDYKETIALKLLPFHGKMSDEETKATLNDAVKKNVTERRVLLATNIAESSLTINNLTVMMDFGMVKVTMYRDYCETEELVTKYCSNDQLKQREGRVGRTKPGLACHMMTKNVYNAGRNILPEMLRQPAENLVLKTMSLRKNEKYKNKPRFIQNFCKLDLLDSPPKERVIEAVFNLMTSGAVYVDSSKFTNISLDKLKMTHVGGIASRLPIDERLSRMILLGNLLLIQQQAVILAAARMNTQKKLFKNSTQSLRILKQVRRWANGNPSDEYADICCIRAWISSQFTTRSDNKAKLSISYDPLVRLYEKNESSQARNSNFYATNPTMMNRIDDNIQDIYTNLKSKQVDILGAVFYREAGNEVQKLTQVKKDEDLLWWVLTAAASRLKYWYQTTVASSLPYQIEEQNTPFNEIILEPAPPSNFDLAVYGPALQRYFARPSNIYPSVEIDRPNDRVIITFPPIGKTAHQTFIHMSVVDVLQRFARGDGNAIAIVYKPITSESSQDDWDYPTPSSSSEFTNREEIKSVESEPARRKFFSTKTEQRQLSRTSLSQQPSRKSSNSKLTTATASTSRKKYMNWLGNQTFAVSNFLTPQCFGVRLCDPSSVAAFVDQGRMLDEVGDRLPPLQLEQVKFGSYCVFTANQSKMVKGSKWNHNFKRAIIKSDLEEDVSTLTDEQKKDYLVAVDCFDVGFVDWVPLKELRYFDAKKTHFGQPELFLKHPPLGYRVILNSLAPNPTRGFHWAHSDMKWITSQLKGEPYNNLVKLKFEEFSEEDRIIVCSDFTNKMGQHPFKEMCIAKKFAIPGRNIKLVNFRDRRPTDTYCPWPISEFTTSEECYDWIVSQGNSSEPLNPPKGYEAHVFTEIRSPLEVGVEACSSGGKQCWSFIDRHSLNHRLLDPALSGIKSSDQYIKRFLIAATLRYKFDKRNNVGKITLSDTSFFPSIPGICPMIALVFQPCLQWVRTKDKKKFHLRVFKKKMDGIAKYYGSMPVRVNFDNEDRNTIKQLRTTVNEFYMQNCKMDEFREFRERLLKFLTRERATLEGPFPFEHDYAGADVTIPCITGQYMSDTISFITWNDDANW